MPTKASLYIFVSPGEEKKATKTIDNMMYLKKPFKFFVDTRPAMLKFKQELSFKDPKMVGTKPTMITLEGYFKRIGPDEYRQLNHTETRKALSWMLKNDVKPQDLTLKQLDTALASVLELDGDSETTLVVPGKQGEERSKGGIILPK